MLELWAFDVGEIQIKGAESGLYLAMDKTGRLYGTEDDKDEGTIFIEMMQGAYLVFLRYTSWTLL